MKKKNKFETIFKYYSFLVSFYDFLREFMLQYKAKKKWRAEKLVIMQHFDATRKATKTMARTKHTNFLLQIWP